MRKIEICGYKRVSKNQAKKLWTAGTTVRVVACNMRPEDMFSVDTSASIHTAYASFDNFVNAFEYFNCFGHQGRYASFYIPE